MWRVEKIPPDEFVDVSFEYSVRQKSRGAPVSGARQARQMQHRYASRLLSTLLAEETEKWGKVVKFAGIKRE